MGRGALNNPFALSPAVDPRTGMPVMDAHVVIEDPLDREQNVARSCFGFPQVIFFLSTYVAEPFFFVYFVIFFGLCLICSLQLFRTGVVQ